MEKEATFLARQAWFASIHQPCKHKPSPFQSSGGVEVRISEEKVTKPCFVDHVAEAIRKAVVRVVDQALEAANREDVMGSSPAAVASHLEDIKAKWST